MMLKQIQLEPENRTFAEIMSNGKQYAVPAFQRDYSWEEAQLAELWEDIASMHTNKVQHFMGYVVLETQNGKQFTIIDGQQRLTTLSLIVIAILHKLKALIARNSQSNENEIRRQQIHNTYLGVFNTITLQTLPKLTLNRNNKAHYKEIISNGYDVPRQHGVTATNHLLNSALQFFQRKVAVYQSGEALAVLLENIADGLVFTTITVKDEVNAYLVFETLNARGVHLSAPDLLKNHLFSVLATNTLTQELEEVEFAWGQVVEQLGETNFTSFLRSYHGMQEKLRYKKDLYRYIKQKVSTPRQVGAYVHDIKKFASIYSALLNPGKGDFWYGYAGGRYANCVPALQMLRLFNVKAPLSLLMIAYDRLTPNQFIQLLQWLEVITFRYNVICNKGAKEQESRYNQLANKIFARSIDFKQLKSELKAVYPNDAEFTAAFGFKRMPSRQSSKKIVFILRNIEAHLAGGQKPDDNLSLEHVLPYRSADAWQQYFGRAEYLEAIDRLGNMALLPGGQNRDLDQASFETKKQVLEKSGLHINAKIASYATWDIDSLSSYQSWLATQAKTVWCMH